MFNLFHKHKKRIIQWRFNYSGMYFSVSWLCDCGEMGNYSEHNFRKMGFSDPEVREIIKKNDYEWIEPSSCLSPNNK